MSERRERLIRLAGQLGLEDRLRDLHGLRSRAARRDRRDMRHVRMLLELTLAEDANCVDVGASSGVVLRQFVRLAPRGTHVAYEPLPARAAQLAADFPTVDVRNAAASDHTGRATFHRVVARDTRSSLSPLDHPREELETFEVDVEDLDTGLPDGLVPAVVKIDVEGAEEQVLRGAQRTLATHRPLVLLEHGRNARHFGTTSTTVHELLTAAGLRVFDIDGRGPYTAPELEHVVDSGRLWTFVAHR